MKLYGKITLAEEKVPELYHEGWVNINITKCNDSEDSYFFENTDQEPPNIADESIADEVCRMLKGEFRCNVEAFCELPDGTVKKICYTKDEHRHEDIVDAVINLLISYTENYCGENDFAYYIEGEATEDDVKKWIDNLIDKHSLATLISSTQPCSHSSQYQLLRMFETRKYRDVLIHLDKKKEALKSENKN